MLGSFLASAAFGLVKGLTAAPGAARGFSAEQDFIGPVQEEFLYRGVPLWAVPGLPFGTTAVTFAVDHVLSDSRKGPMTTKELVGRFGDVLLGGLLYEKSFRSAGLLGAIASHSAHNLFVGVGSHIRSRFK